jgi:hypothetical protein
LTRDVVYSDCHLRLFINAPVVEPGPKKRRRVSSSTCQEPLDFKGIEELCARIIDKKLDGLRADVTKQLHDLEARVMDYVDEQLGLQRRAVTGEIGELIEEEYYGLKLDLQNYLHEEVEDAQGKIVDRLSGATVSLQFDNI